MALRTPGVTVADLDDEIARDRGTCGSRPRFSPDCGPKAFPCRTASSCRWMSRALARDRRG